MKLTYGVAALALLLASSVPAAAFPIAIAGTEGFSVIVGSLDPVVATFQGNSGSFSNDLYLMLDAGGNPGDDGNFANDQFVFNNQTSVVGSTVGLGSFAIGTELIFRLHVTDTGDQFYTGPAARNVDGFAHARVEGNWLPGEALVSFEDLNGGPFDFNDLSFSFTNTEAQAVPEPAALGLLGLGLASVAARLRRVRQ
jgi:hypothetical protein